MMCTNAFTCTDMATQCAGQRVRSRPMAKGTTANRLSLYAIILSMMYISSVMALSQNPSTNRYLKEMGRLLQDHRLNVVASPEMAPTEMEADPIFHDGDGRQFGEYDWQQNQPPSGDFQADEATLNMVDEGTVSQEAQQRYDTPRPPADPYFQRQRELFEGYYRQNQTPNDSYMQRQSSSQQTVETTDQPRTDTDLFEALNEQIEALDQQMQTPTSFGDAIVENTPQSYSEWGYDVSDVYYDSDEEHSPPQYQVGDDYSASQSQYDYVEANGAIYDQTQYDTHETNGQYESYEPSPNEAALRQELERLAAEKRAAEEAAARAEQELRERERLERERLEQEQVAAAQAEAARAELKKALEREMARFEEGKRQQQTTSTAITRSKRIHDLPVTRDPLELLGLDYRNPPESANELRKAFLRMAKKYHPDAIASDATTEERETASLNFARINTAYQFLKDKQERLGDEYFATMLGGPMYEPRRSNSHIRQPFSRGYGFDGYGSIFSGNDYSADYGPRNRERPPHNGNSRNPFSRRRQEVGDNCHVSGEDWY